MKELMVPIDQAGRFVLPKDIREELGINAGDMLKVSVAGSAVTLTPNRESVGFVRKGKALIFSTAGEKPLRQETVETVLEKGRREREEGSVAGLQVSKLRE